jgi:hypothetical protein
MDEDDSVQDETPKKGTGASEPVSTPEVRQEPAFSEAPNNDGSPKEVAANEPAKMKGGMKARRNEPQRIETPANLEWPPTKEDLERLYVKEHLSAMKISKLYGLKYPNPKSGEAMILYHLKRKGISRRDAAEHIRKVTEEMVDGWVKRYKTGESLKQIAANEFSPVTVFLHLRKRGVQLRDKVEAQIKAVTKHAKKPFGGSPIDKAYLSGLVYGDCNVVMHGRAVRVRTGTTHPCMIELLCESFNEYGFVHQYLKPAVVTEMEWNLEVDIDSSFDFLLRSEPLQADGSRKEFMGFLAGFTDAEGSIYFHEGGSFEISIGNTDHGLQEKIMEQLRRLGYHPTLQCQDLRSATVKYPANGKIWYIRIWRHLEVVRLLRELPLRHPEKVRKAGLAIEWMISGDSLTRQAIMKEWNLHLESIKLGVRILIRNAKLLWEAKQSLKRTIAK